MSATLNAREYSRILHLEDASGFFDHAAVMAVAIRLLTTLWRGARPEKQTPRRNPPRRRMRAGFCDQKLG
jgi:hypothetical protein